VVVHQSERGPKQSTAGGRGDEMDDRGSEAGDRANDIGWAGRDTIPDWGVAVSARRCSAVQHTFLGCDRGGGGWM
jgi:hypothetical protein